MSNPQNIDAIVLQDALRQLRARANGQNSTIFHWEAQALLDERNALRKACESLYQIVLNGMAEGYDHMTQELDKPREALGLKGAGHD